MATRHDRPRTDFRLLLFYGLVSLVVLALGSTVVVSYFQRQFLLERIAAEPIPPIVIVTPRPDSPDAAAWVRLLTAAKIGTKVVTVDELPAVRDGVVAFLGVETLSPAAQTAAQQHLARGAMLLGSVQGAIASLSSTQAARARAPGMLQLSSQPSPLLARVTPGHEAWFNESATAWLDEAPDMQIDARWRDSGRAAIAHFERTSGRVAWFGFSPSALQRGRDTQLEILMRTAARWVAGQPVTDAAAGDPAGSKALSLASRKAARDKRLGFSADRLEDEPRVSVRIVNRQPTALRFVSVNVWLPPGVRSVKLEEPLIGRRDVTMERVGDAVVVFVPKLAGNEERLLKLKLR